MCIQGTQIIFTIITYVCIICQIESKGLPLYTWSYIHPHMFTAILETEQRNGPRREKTCLRGFRQSEIQTSLLSYRDYLETWHFACSKSRYDSLQQANNKGADQTARMHRLVCVFVIRKSLKTGFLATMGTSSWPITHSYKVARRYPQQSPSYGKYNIFWKLRKPGNNHSCAWHLILTSYIFP